MAAYLLDTHVLLWWLADPEQLSAKARTTIAAGSHAIYVSAAAAWEMAIKKGLGRLEFPGNLPDVLRREHIEVLPISLSHALAMADLPGHHRDPFDRIQIAQARLEELTLITRDPRISQYDVEVLEA